MPRIKRLPLLIALTLCGSAAFAKLPNVTDSYGREIVMHGLSSSNTAKWSKDAMSWETQADITAQAAQTGASAVRLTIFWAKIEPEQGKYDDKYLALVAQRVQMYANAGIQVVLDMHQDLYGPYVVGPKGDGSNNGAPLWATFTDGLPVKNVKPWGLMYFQPGIKRAFDHLWGTVPTTINLPEAYAKMWQHVAQYFANNKMVIGYDLFNEPFGGGAVHKATFEKIWLSRFYQTSINAIRQVDPNKWIFVEPDAFLVNQAFPSSLVISHDPRPGAAHIAYAPHEYVLPMEFKAGFTGMNKLLVKAGVSIWFNHAYATASNANAPLWIGEFGAGNFSAPGFIDYIKYATAKAKSYNAGWAYWASDSMKGANLALAGEAMATPYAKAVPGQIITNDYVPDRKTLEITWDPKPTLDNAPLEVYLPSSDYPNGYTFTSNIANVTSQWNEATRTLSVNYLQTSHLESPLKLNVVAR